MFIFFHHFAVFPRVTDNVRTSLYIRVVLVLSGRQLLLLLFCHEHRQHHAIRHHRTSCDNFGGPINRSGSLLCTYVEK